MEISRLICLFQAFRGPRLSTLGIVQAERLRDRLAGTKEIRADVLISSPLQRTWQTAEIIAPALELPVMLDYDIGLPNRIPWQQITPDFSGGPGQRPVQVKSLNL